MTGYVARKLILLVPLLLGITFITFLLTKALPGEPVYSMVGERASPETIDKLRKEIGSDKGTISQYAGYLNLILHGELGRSYYTNRKVSEEIMIKLPNTMKLAAGAMFIAVPVGILLGFLSAVRKNRFADRLISVLSIAGLSVPVFWSGLMLMLFFSLYLKWLPPSGTGDIRYMVLPAVTLALPSVSSFARITRTAVLETGLMPFVRTATAKGISKTRIYAVHIMKNALLPVVTVVGLDLGSYLNGAVLTETIFGWDGMGRFIMEGIIKRDYPVIMGCIITGTIVFVLINLVVDIAYSFIDPRVRINGTDR